MPFLIIYRETNNIFYALKWQIFTAAFIFLGVMIIFREIIKGDFSDFDITQKKERLRFYLIILILGILYLSAIAFLKGIFFSISIISLGLALGVVIFATANIFIKASIHSAVVVSFIITMSILYGLSTLLLTIWLFPLVLFARVYLKKHSLQEIFVGGMLGGVITLVTFFIGKNYVVYLK